MAFRPKFSFNRKVSIGKVVSKIVATVLTLYVGGTIMTSIGSQLNGTCSPFYQGLSLIGYTIGTTAAAAGNVKTSDCVGSTSYITSTSGSGILTVVGLIGIASIVLEFVNFRLR